MAAEGYQVYKSTDKGKTWTRSDSGLPGHSRINAFTSIENIVLAGTDSGIFISSGDVADWRRVTNGVSGSSRIVCLASIGKHVFAGTDGKGILRSEDAAGSWARLSTFSSSKIRCMVVHQETLFVGTESDGVFESDDAGQSWKRLSIGFPNRAQVFAMTVVQGELFAALYGQGLYHWRRDTQQWQKVGSVTPLVLVTSGNHLVVGHNPGGIQWSDDLGVNWYAGLADVNCGVGIPLFEQPQHLTSDAPVWEMASLGNMVLAGALDGIYYSKDRGRTWTRARTGLPAESPGISFLVTDQFILAGISGRSNGGND